MLKRDKQYVKINSLKENDYVKSKSFVQNSELITVHVFITSCAVFKLTLRKRVIKRVTVIIFLKFKSIIIFRKRAFFYYKIVFMIRTIPVS